MISGKYTLLTRMIGETYALTVRELKRWYRHMFAIVFTLITPLFWLGLFGKSFNLTSMFNLPSEVPPPIDPAIFEEFSKRIIVDLFGTQDYFTFMACGMLSILVLFTSMWSGMSIVWDRRFGFLNKLLAAPISTSSIVLSRVASSLIRGMVQVMLIFTAAVIFGLKLAEGFGPLHLFGVFAVLALLSVSLSSIFVAMAFKITSHETLVALANLVNLPLMFASNALFPLKQMPEWLQAIAKFNPITYTVEVVRGLVLANIDTTTLLFDLSVLVTFALVVSALGIFVSHKTLNR